jgi:hypothetical protein
MLALKSRISPSFSPASRASFLMLPPCWVMVGSESKRIRSGLMTGRSLLEALRASPSVKPGANVVTGQGEILL